jgi:hypothetical protein
MSQPHRPEGSERPQPARDPELYYQASTVPGSHLPHVWVGDATHTVSTLDLTPYTALTLITGIAGEAWAAATEKTEDELDVPISTVIIARDARSPTPTTTGRGSVRSTRTACYRFAPTGTSAGARCPPTQSKPWARPAPASGR